MAREAKMAADAKKLARYDRVVEIIRDHMALESHKLGRSASFDEILFAREDAYRDVVDVVIGADALLLIKPEKRPETRPPASPRNPRNRAAKSSVTSKKGGNAAQRGAK